MTFNEQVLRFLVAKQEKSSTAEEALLTLITNEDFMEEAVTHVTMLKV